MASDADIVTNLNLGIELPVLRRDLTGRVVEEISGLFDPILCIFFNKLSSKTNICIRFRVRLRFARFVPRQFGAQMSEIKKWPL